jgi:hypothetical protein
MNISVGWYGSAKKAFWAQGVFMGGRDNRPAMTNLGEIRTHGDRSTCYQIPGFLVTKFLSRFPAG